MHGVASAEKAREPRDVRIDRRIAILDRIAVTFRFENASRFGVDETQERRFDDRPRLAAELIVDASRAAGNRGKQRGQSLRGRAVGEPRLPHRAEAPGLLLNQTRHDALVGDQISGQRRDFAPKSEFVACKKSGRKRALVVGWREEKAKRRRSFDRERRHIQQCEMRNDFVGKTELVCESVAWKRCHA